MSNRVPSTVARNADGEDVTTAALRGEKEYYPEIMDHINDTETLQHLILLTTNRGYAISNIIVDDADVRGCPHRLNAMGLSDERVLLISEDQHNSENHCRSISYHLVKSIHGSPDKDSYAISLLTKQNHYTINTAKSNRISNFHQAMKYLSDRVDEDHQPPSLSN